MSATEIFVQGFELVNQLSHEVTVGLSGDELTVRLDAEANSVGWLVWHIARVRDQEFAGLTGAAELWSTEGWDSRFALPGTTSTGEGHTVEEVAAVPVSDVALLLAYSDAVHARIIKILERLDDAALSSAVGDASDMSKREKLLLILSALNQHCGQAAFIRGILMRRRLAISV